jgi:hypothetical protein
MANKETSSAQIEKRSPGLRLVGRTVTGPIYLAHGVLISAPPRVAFENLFELGIRAVQPDAKVISSIAGRHSGEDASFANLAFTGLAAGSLLAAPVGLQRAVFDELSIYLLLKGDATGLESLYLTTWQTLWPIFGPAEQRRAIDIWNEMIRYGRVAQKFGVVGFDRVTATFVPFKPKTIIDAGVLKWSQASSWLAGGGSIGRGDPGSGSGQGSSPFGDPGSVPGGRGDPGSGSGQGSSPFGDPGSGRPGGAGSGSGQGGSFGDPGNFGGSGPGSGSFGGPGSAGSGLGQGSGGYGGPGGAGSGLGQGSGGYGGLQGGRSSEGEGSAGSFSGGVGGLTGGGQGGSGTLSGQDPNGPLGGIIANLGARADAQQDRDNQKALGNAEVVAGGALVALGGFIATLGAIGIGVTSALGLPPSPGSVAEVCLGSMLVGGGTTIVVDGAVRGLGAARGDSAAAAKEREKSKKLPPDILRGSEYALQVTSLTGGEGYANGDGSGKVGSAGELGLRQTLAEFLIGDGLDAFVVTNEAGHVRVPALFG